jgi:hypothetical protein
MQKTQGSKTESNAWPALLWSPASWFPMTTASTNGAAKSGASSAQVGFEGIEAAFQSWSQGANPWLKAIAQANSEMMSLIAQRSHALMELPVKVSQVRQPQDIMQIQSQYLQTALQQHSDVVRRIVSVWGSVMPMAGALSSSMGQTPAAPARDVIAVPEARDPVKESKEAGKDGNGSSSSRSQGSDRRSAA